MAYIAFEEVCRQYIPSDRIKVPDIENWNQYVCDWKQTYKDEYTCDDFMNAIQNDDIRFIRQLIDESVYITGKKLESIIDMMKTIEIDMQKMNIKFEFRNLRHSVKNEMLYVLIKNGAEITLDVIMKMLDDTVATFVFELAFARFNGQLLCSEPIISNPLKPINIDKIRVILNRPSISTYYAIDSFLNSIYYVLTNIDYDNHNQLLTLDEREDFIDNWVGILSLLNQMVVHYPDKNQFVQDINECLKCVVKMKPTDDDDGDSDE